MKFYAAFLPNDFSLYDSTGNRLAEAAAPSVGSWTALCGLVSVLSSLLLFRGDSFHTSGTLGSASSAHCFSSLPMFSFVVTSLLLVHMQDPASTLSLKHPLLRAPVDPWGSRPLGKLPPPGPLCPSAHLDDMATLTRSLLINHCSLKAGAGHNSPLQGLVWGTPVAVICRTPQGGKRHGEMEGGCLWGETRPGSMASPSFQGQANACFLKQHKSTNVLGFSPQRAKTSDLSSLFQMGTHGSGTAKRRQGNASEAGGQPTEPADSSAD